MTPTRQAHSKTRSKRTVRYEKGQKIRGVLLSDKTPTRRRQNKETFVNIVMTCTL